MLIRPMLMSNRSKFGYCPTVDLSRSTRNSRSNAPGSSSSVVDAAAASAVLAFAPLRSGGDVPQNLVFLSSRTEYYYVIVATSILALSPALVIWTGLCTVIGLAGATVWIISGMERIVSLGDLPSSPSRADVLAVVLSPDFLGIPVRVIEGLVIAVVTSIATL